MILDNVVPITNQTFPFVSCFSSWLISMGKSALPMDKLKIKHQNLYRQYMPVTGCGVVALWNENEPTIDTCYGTGGDNYLKWAMQYAGYEYEILDNDGTNRSEFIKEIKESIASSHPVMAQGLIGTTWCLITGYDDEVAALYGWHQSNWGICANPAAEHLNNGMFVKKSWYEAIKRIVICKGKSKEKLDAEEIISHLISVIESKQEYDIKKGQVIHNADNITVSNIFTGEDAYRKCLDILSDDSVYENITEQHLQEVYKSVFFFCTTFAEARVFTGSTIETSEFKKKIKASDQVKWLLNQAALPLRDSHKTVYEIWAVLGENYNFEPEKYVTRIKDKDVRKQLITLVNRLKKNDNEALKFFKQCR